MPDPWARSSAGPTPTSPRRFSRPGAAVPALVIILVAAVAVTMMRTPSSKAADSSGATSSGTTGSGATSSGATVSGASWLPGDVSWTYLPDVGQCLTTQEATVAARSHEDAVRLAGILQALGHKKDFPAGSGVLDIHANVGTVSSTGTTLGVVVHSYVTKDSCGSDARTPSPGDGSPDAGSPGDERATSLSAGNRLATTITWKRGLLAGLLAATVFTAVGLMATTALVGVGTAAGVTVSATLVAATSSCLGGAAAGAASTLYLNSGASWKEILGGAAFGCVASGLASTYPLKQAARAITDTLRNRARGGAPAIIGPAGVEAASGATGSPPTGIAEVVSTTADGVARAAS